MTTTDHADPAVEALDVGAPPRAPLSRRARRRLAAGGVGLVVAAVAVFLVVRPDEPEPTPEVATTPAVEPSAGFAAGPVLVQGDEQDFVTVPGAAMFGGAAMNVPVEPDDALVRIIRTSVPTLEHVRGGRVTDPEVHYGFYLQGAYTDRGGLPVQLTLYTARAAGTPQDRSVAIDRVFVDGVTLVRTDASFYTGTGWWVHGIATAPDGTDASSGQADVLQALVADSRLVA